MLLLPEPDTPCEAVQQLTDAEREALATFRTLVPPCDTVTAMWFIRARKTKTKKGIVYDTKKSSKMYNDHLEWRKSYGTDALIHNPPEASPQAWKALNERFNPKLIRAKDLKGRPVMYLAYGKLDTGALEKQGVSQELILRRYVYEMEKLRLDIAASADPLAGHLQIIDAYSMSVSGFWRSWKFFMAMSKVGSDNYPELLGCACVVRGISAGQWVLNQVKKFLDPVTAAKIEMHVGDPRKALLQHLRPEDVDYAFSTLFEGGAEDEGTGGNAALPPGTVTSPETRQRSTSRTVDVGVARVSRSSSVSSRAHAESVESLASSHGADSPAEGRSRASSIHVQAVVEE